MKYETFKSILKALEKQHEVDRQINKVLQLAQSDTYFMGTTVDEIGKHLIRYLKMPMMKED